MAGRQDIPHFLAGALRLARFDSGGVENFDNTAAIARRSFIAMIVVAPMYGLFVLLNGMGSPEGTPVAAALYFEVMIYICGWMLFPVIMWPISETIGRRHLYFRFVATYNWIIVIQNLLFVGLDLVLRTMGDADGPKSFFGLCLLIYVIAYAWFSVRHALELTAGTAALIVVIDVLLSFFWEGATSALIG